MRSAVAGAVLAVVSIVLAAAGVVYSGMLNVAADKPHWPLTERLLQTVRSWSIEARSDGVGPIPDLDDPRRILAGAGQYGEMCAVCHLAPGMSDTPLRQGLNPRPPELAGYRMDPRTSFWIVKHGIKMTGMPAWGPSHDDDVLWSIVAFLRKLPELDAKQYRDLMARAPVDEAMQKGRATPSKPEHGH